MDAAVALRERGISVAPAAACKVVVLPSVGTTYITRCEAGFDASFGVEDEEGNVFSVSVWFRVVGGKVELVEASTGARRRGLVAPVLADLQAALRR